MVTSNTFIYVLINYFQLILFFQICWWDSREGGQPAGMIPMDQCHIDPVYKTIWLNAKAGTEFFTGSTDGMVRFFNRIRYQVWSKTKSLNEKEWVKPGKQISLQNYCMSICTENYGKS